MRRTRKRCAEARARGAHRKIREPISVEIAARDRVSEVVAGPLAIDRSISYLQAARITLTIAVAIDAVAELGRPGIDRTDQGLTVVRIRRAVAIIVEINAVRQHIRIRVDKEIDERTVTVRVSVVACLSRTWIHRGVVVVTVLAGQRAIAVKIRLLH